MFSHALKLAMHAEMHVQTICQDIYVSLPKFSSSKGLDYPEVKPQLKAIRIWNPKYWIKLKHDI